MDWNSLAGWPSFQDANSANSATYSSPSRSAFPSPLLWPKLLPLSELPFPCLHLQIHLAQCLLKDHSPPEASGKSDSPESPQTVILPSFPTWYLIILPQSRILCVYLSPLNRPTVHFLGEVLGLPHPCRPRTPAMLSILSSVFFPPLSCCQALSLLTLPYPLHPFCILQPDWHFKIQVGSCPCIETFRCHLVALTIQSQLCLMLQTGLCLLPHALSAPFSLLQSSSPAPFPSWVLQ